MLTIKTLYRVVIAGDDQDFSTKNLEVMPRTRRLSTFFYNERSDECIEFTMMMCVFFFVSVYSITCRNNASISNFRGGFRWQMTQKPEFLRKTSF
ncbi:Uncharacterized protein FWK35_00019788 [Aphis craccivora]|uniref:Uncharacterized protein n=1 Tax=Aphis craccivora TaxID=307492 RepID=A0A6G0YQL6_APHCR|nr:Uncharacterized protein FWK35_00019788 [Aphis craccivora]